MASPAHLQKLIENMKRANLITDRAAVDSERHGLIMDSFEKRLDLNGENMEKIAEYDKLMAAMDEMGNGGPALETTFQSTSTTPAVVTKSSTSGVGMFNH